MRDAITPEQRERIGTRRVIVSVSGGKDSVALWLWARRSGLDPVAVYADTHWELEANEGQKDGPHYEHLALLESRIGPLHRCAQGYTFEERVALNRSFPSRVRKWCTPELKRLIKSGTPKEAAGPSVVPAPIDDVLAWARTTRGGQQLALLAPPSGCMRWGSCDAPVRDNEGAA